MIKALWHSYQSANFRPWHAPLRAGNPPLIVKLRRSQSKKAAAGVALGSLSGVAGQREPITDPAAQCRVAGGDRGYCGGERRGAASRNTCSCVHYLILGDRAALRGDNMVRMQFSPLRVKESTRQRHGSDLPSRLTEACSLRSTTTKGHLWM